MRQRQVRFVVLLGAISIIGIIAVQGYFLLNARNIREKQLVQTINIGLKSVAEKMAILNHSTLPYGNPVRQLSSNYFVVDINTVIDANILEYYLKSEFSRLNLSSDYEYAIYDCHTDKMVYGNYISAGGDEGSFKPSGNLPKYSEYLYYFGIHFPSLKNTVTGDMAIWFFFTSILILSVIFFAWSIFIILKQKQYSELQKDFINNMTHEFKTPISSINISADVILQPQIIHDPARLTLYGNVIKQENARLNEQVEKVLQIAKIERIGIQLKKSRIDLNALIETVVANFNDHPDMKIRIGNRPDSSIPMVPADVIHTTNLFRNLLDNAVKYSTDKPVISVTTKLESKKIIVEVIDNGPGIDPKYHKRVFQKFFRVPSGNLHDVKGFGLGLYYVKNVCRSHGWKIRVESTPGAGTNFILQIPIKNYPDGNGEKT